MEFKHPASGPYTADSIKVATALDAALASPNCALSISDKKFAESLLWDFKEGKATHKQRYWIGVMADKAMGDAKAIAKVVNVPAQLALSGYAGVYALFQKAKASLILHPKIKLVLPSYMEGEQIGDGQYATKQTGGGELQLSVAGASSKYKGKIMVTDGKPYGQNKWYGTIDADGVFKGSKLYANESAQLQCDIAKLLADLGEKPAEVAALYGQKTGHCCYCGLALTDPKSVAVGYGPICAEKWGLPWGADKVDNAKPVDVKALNEAINEAAFKPYALKSGSKIEFNPKPGSIADIAPNPVSLASKITAQIASHNLAKANAVENPTLSAPARKKQEFLF